jgi:aryl-alcohol dehydrogenase-like predicted oxidoreductase
MNLNSKIGLGSVQFGLPYGVSNYHGQTSTKEVTSILSYAENSGITYIDTASAYGNAEKVLGSNNLNNFRIISKFMPDGKDNSISLQLNKSLSLLKIDSLYGYLSHRPISLISNQNQWEELLVLKQQNKIKKIGFSLNEPSEFDLLYQEGMIPDLVQVPYNYFDNRFISIIKALKKEGCEIHTRSTFLQGLFFTNVKKLPPFFDEIKNSITELQNNLGVNLSCGNGD